MRTTLAMILLGTLVATQKVQAQQPKIDSATIARANKPILRTGELIGVLAATAIGMALDQTLRNKFHDNGAGFGHTATQVGNAIGSPFEYPVWFGLAAIGKVAGSKGLYGVASRAFKSIAVAGAGGMILKVIAGRQRPTQSPNDAFTFRPFSFNDNSFPSGHTTVAFALATSLAREIKGQWDDVAFFSLATLTAYSRMRDDKHWFSDVVFGAGVGILSARFVHRREAKILLGKNLIGASLDF